VGPDISVEGSFWILIPAVVEFVPGMAAWVGQQFFA